MKRLIIIILCIAMALMFAVVSPLQLAAASKRKYVSELKIAYGTDERDALVADGYTSVKDSLNPGNSVEVYLCYKTTENVGEAICDISMMNMAGNYSFAKFDEMLASKKEQVAAAISRWKTGISEFVTNYNAGTYAAKTAYKMLNLFTDDDTGKAIGTLFVDGITDEQLTTMLIQGNTKLIASIESAVLLGCAQTANGNTLFDTLATLNIDDEYSENIYEVRTQLVSEYDSMQSLLEFYETTWADAEAYGIVNGLIADANDMTVDVLLKYVDENSEKFDSDSINNVILGLSIYNATNDVNYAQSGFTVYQILTKELDKIKSVDALMAYYLNPLADALSPAQYAFMQDIGLLGILSQAVMTEKDFDDAYDELAESVNENGYETLSVYMCVDRTIYNGGNIALTTDASTESYANENYDWTNPESRDIYLTAKTVQKVAQIVVVAALGIMAIFFAWGTIAAIAAHETAVLGNMFINWISIKVLFSGYGDTIAEQVVFVISDGATWLLLIAAALAVCLGAFIVSKCYEKLANQKDKFVSYTYTDIPDIVIDYVDDDSIDGNFIYFYAVTKADGTLADLNGWDNKTNKYWNALYVSYDSRVGNPITEGFIVSSGNTAPDGMVGVHDFEKGVEGVKAAVNLNQSSKAQDTAIYLYYNTYNANTQTSSVFSSGAGIAALVGAFVLGLAISGGTVYAMTKKKKAEENA